MSNWLRAKVSTEIKNPKRYLFDKACEDMGFRADFKRKRVYGSYSEEASEPVDCVLVYTDTGEPSTIGFTFRQNADNKVEMSVTGDFWGLGYDGPQFMRQLAMHYNREMIAENLEEQGFVIEETRVEEKEVVLVGRRMAA